MILDLKTSEPYFDVIYEDASDVILMAPHGESHISAQQFAEAVDLAEAGGLVWVTTRRYQSPAVDLATPPDPEPVELRIRRGELARYAASNGGQIATHIEPEAPPETPSAARRALGWVKDTFGSPT